MSIFLSLLRERITTILRYILKCFIASKANIRAVTRIIILSIGIKPIVLATVCAFARFLIAIEVLLSICLINVCLQLRARCDYIADSLGVFAYIFV